MKRNYKTLISTAILTLAVIFTQNAYAQSPVSDHADLSIIQSFITTQGSTSIEGDVSDSQFRGNNDQMEFDLSDVSSLGTNYTVRWKKDTPVSSNAAYEVEESADEYSFLSPFTSSNDAVNSENTMPLEPFNLVDSKL